MKRTAWWIAGVLAALVVGFAVGKHQAPTKEKLVVQEDTRAREELRQLKEQLATLKSHTRRKEVTKPDGTRTVTTDTRLDATTDTRTSTNATTAVDASVATTKTIEHAAPSWFIGPMVLVVPQAFKVNDPAAMLNVGLITGKHIVGPFSASASLTVPVSKPISLPTLGLALTASF